MRLIAKFAKREQVRFVSHLDIQRMFQRAFRRADIPLAYSYGFNPHPQLSFATALSTGVTSECEWLDVVLERDYDWNDFIFAVNNTLPNGFSILECRSIDEKAPSLTSLLQSASYTVVISDGIHRDALETAAAELLSAPITVIKKTKGGMKPVDIRPQVYELAFGRPDEKLVLHIRGQLNAAGSLNVDTLMKELIKTAGKDFAYSVQRDRIDFLQHDSALGALI